MSELFLTILNMSISASWLILAVILVHFLFKKAPKRYFGILWILVGFKLISNFTIESFYSLIPSSNTIPLNITVVKNPAIESGIEVINNSINPILMDSSTTMMESAGLSFIDVLIQIGTFVWIIGMVVMLLYNVISYLSLKHKISASICYVDNIYFCDDIDSPFILGYLYPRIYLPSNIDRSYMSHILCHEKEHIKHFDHIKKLIGMVLLSIHFFNPMVWIAYIYFSKDIEMACDERVTASMEEETRIAYCKTLINMSVSSNLFACPLAFAEVGVKTRVKSILDYKKPAFWVTLVSFGLCVFLAVGFIFSPMNKTILTIEDRIRGDYSNFFDDVESIKVSTHKYSYTSVFEEDIETIIGILKTMKIGSKPVNEDRSTSREMTNRIALNQDRMIYFDEEFKTLWIKDAIGTSYTYKIKDSKEVKKIFEPLYMSTSEDGKGPSFLDLSIQKIENGEIYLSPLTSGLAHQTYIVKMDLTEDMLSKLKPFQFVRVIYDGYLTQMNPSLITEVRDIYILNKTTVTSNAHELSSLDKQHIITAINTEVYHLNKQIADNMYRAQDLYTINQYASIYVYYDEEESKALCERYGYDENTFAIIEKYYGSSVLVPGKEEGYGYHFYAYEIVDGVNTLVRKAGGGKIYDN